MPWDNALDKYVHPKPDPYSRCPCGRPAVAKCESCAGNFCDPCWSRHTHTVEPLPKGWAGQTYNREVRDGKK